jgi:hypothetical protein
LITTVAMMATIVSSATLVLRSTQTAWAMHASDQSRLDAAYATLRHVSRMVRQAESVTAISASGDTSGALTVVLSTGQTVVWDHAGSDVSYGVNTPTSLLATGVSALSFVGYEADGVTATTVPGDVKSVVCTVTVALERTSTPTRTISSRMWIRAW